MLKLLLALCMTLAGAGALAQKTIRLNVAPGGFPPYTIVDKSQPASGLMVELLSQIAAKAGYKVITQEIPRNRVESMMRQNALDASPRAREWTRAPNDFLFSEPVLQVRDVVLSRKNAPFAYSTPESLFGKRVGTVLGFVYPVLEPYFAKKQITRVDVASEKSLLAMLNLHRVDVVLINEFSALWHINSENWGYTFAYSKNEVQSYPYRMMFGKKWQPFVQVFNRELAAMKKDGSLDRLIQKYQPEKTVQQQ